MSNFTDDFEYYKTANGVIVPDTSNVLNGVQEDFKSLFGNDFNVDPETPQGRIIELLTRSRVFTLQMAAACSNMLNLNRANGFVLDDLGSLFYLSRSPATHTTGSVDLSGVPGTNVPAGTRLQNTNGDVFVITSSPNIIGDSGSVVAQYAAEDYGPIVCPANTLTTILDRVSGLETVNNASNQSTIGSEVESDAVFRERIKASQQKNALSVIGSIRAAVANVAGVSSVKVLENDSTSSVVSAGITIPAHGFAVVVDGGESQEIAQAIFNKKTLGSGYPTGSATITQTSGSGLTDLTVNIGVFETKIITSGSYVFSYDGNDWSYDGNTVNLNTYGISFNGTPVNGDEITVYYVSAVASGLTLVTATVSDGDDDFTVKFVRPEEVSISVSITVKAQDYTGSDLEGDVKKAIIDMAAGLNEEVDGWKIGSEVSIYEIGAAVSSTIPEIFIKEVTATGMGGGITSSQKPVISANDITVVIE